MHIGAQHYCPTHHTRELQLTRWQRHDIIDDNLWTRSPPKLTITTAKRIINQVGIPPTFNHHLSLRSRECLSGLQMALEHTWIHGDILVTCTLNARDSRPLKLRSRLVHISRTHFVLLMSSHGI
jgi:hypothetical protein